MRVGVSRRDLLRSVAAAGLSRALVPGASVLAALPGCGIYEAEEGVAFEPWNYPGNEKDPPRLAARAGLLASSPHNTQPWAMTITGDTIALRARRDRNLGAMDSLLREMHVGLGCAVEAMSVAARGTGRAPEVALLPDAADETLVARVTLGAASAVTAEDSALFGNLARRHTNRGRYVEAAATPALETAFRALVRDEAVAMRWLASDDERAIFRAETIAATEAIIGDREMSRDSNAWYRHTDEEIARFRDGTTLDATGNGAATRTFGKALGRPSNESADDYWLSGTVDRQTTGSAFVILSSSRASTREEQLRVGRVYQRMHLWATGQGLAMQPLNQLAERQDREEVTGVGSRFTTVLTSFVGEDRRAQMLFRVGYPWDRAFASPRRPLEWVLA